MTAVLCFRRKDSVTFYTDGACYHGENGSFLYPHQKTDILLHQPCVLATRGNAFAGSRLKERVSNRSSFDSTVASVAKDLHRASEDAFRACEEVNLAVFFGGWSERAQEFELYRTWIGGNSPTDLDDGALELKKVTGTHKIEPDPDFQLLAERGILKDGVMDLRRGDADVIELMQCQRETLYSFGRNSRLEGCIVGAFIQKTVLTCDAAQTAIIHRWDDKVGEKLGAAHEQRGFTE
jgi:hypothetical protein